MGTLQQYFENFDVMYNKTNFNEAQTIIHFLGCLREEIELSIKLFSPVTLQLAYSLAKI